MSNNTKIFSEAIAEAKAIRETAMTNAKLALEEAFAPRMQEMMSNKLEALAEEDEEMEEEFTGKNTTKHTQHNDDSMDEISLEELIAELDGLEESSYSEKAGSVDPGVDDPYMEENTLAEAEDECVGCVWWVVDLKDIIRGVLNDVMGSEEEEGEAEEAGEEEAEDAEELNLDEILAELDSLNEGEELNELGPEYIAGAAQLVEMFPFLTMSSASLIIGALGAAGLTGFSVIVAKVTDMALAGKFGSAAKSFAEKLQAAGGAAAKATQNREGVEAVNKEEQVSENEELEEAMSTIATLRSELNEVNLLNAKLLYVNKLFKSKNLTEAQKVKVINAFDRAETVKETKNIFETLKESLNTPVKGAIKESLSFASKAAGVADRKPIVENNDFVARMQKLAGII